MDPWLPKYTLQVESGSAINASIWSLRRHECKIDAPYVFPRASFALPSLTVSILPHYKCPLQVAYSPSTSLDMRSFAALSIVLLATSASASPVVTMPLTKLQRSGAYLKGSPDADRARAALLKSRTASGPTTVPATNLEYVQYTSSVGIGNPPTYYNLVVDTGSSNTFCG